MSELVHEPHLPLTKPGKLREMTRILLTSNTWTFLASHRRELIERCLSRGWEVHLAAPEPLPSDGRFPDAVVRHEFQLNRYGTNPIQEALAVLRFAARLREIRPDILHNFTMKAITIGSAAASLVGTRAIVNSVTGLGLASAQESRSRSLALRLGIEATAAWPRASYICQNSADAEELRRRVPKTSDVLEVLGSGVNLARFRAIEHEPEGAPTFVLASRLLGNKGVRVFAEAAALVRSRGVDARFLLAGPFDDSHPTAVTRDEVRAWTNASALEFLGEIDDVPALLARTSVAVLPSLGGEGVPKFLLEAVATGTPFVTTDVPGCADLAAASKCGLVVPHSDAPNLAATLEKLATTAALRNELRAAALAFRPNVDVTAIVDKHMNLYERTLRRFVSAGQSR